MFLLYTKRIPTVEGKLKLDTSFSYFSPCSIIYIAAELDIFYLKIKPGGINDISERGGGVLVVMLIISTNRPSANAFHSESPRVK